MKYLIAVDSSENSHYAFSQAKKRFFTQKDHVYILTVTESPTAYPFEDLLNFSTESYNEMNRKIEQMYAELLKKYGRKLTRSSIPHTCLLARGTIKDVICRQAQDLCVDVVIMGRRGLGKLERTFIGSTSQYCVHNLNCSVMVIPYIEQEKTPAKQPEELATEISSKEEEEVSGKEFKKGSKFEKIGQYEKEKWQQKEIKSEEFEGEDHPPLPFDDKMLKDQKKHLKHEEDEGTIEHVGNVNVKEQKEIKSEEFKGEDHPTLPFDDKMLKEQKKHLKHEEFEEENLKDRPAVPFDDKMLKEQKKNLKHEEEFEEENLEHPSLPFDDKMLKEQKGHLKHEEGTIDVIEERKVDEPTKNVAKESTKKKRKNKKKKNNNNNKGNVGKSVGKWEDVTKESSKGSGKVSEKDLPPPLPIESLPHDISSEPITGDLLEKQKKKLKHEEGSIDVIEEETNPKHVSENIIHKGEGKSSAAASSGSSEISSEGAKKKKNRKKRKNNKNKAKETTKETTKKSEKVSEKDLPPPLPIESLPHDISSEPITGDLLEKQKKKLKHEEGSIDVIEEETKQKDVGENLQQNVPVKEKKTKRKKKNNKKKNNNNNNNNKGKAEENLSKDSSKKSEKVSEKDLPPPLPIESLPHNISSEPITGDLLEKQKQKLKHEEGSIDVIEEETKEEGNIKQKGKEKGKKSEGKFEKKQKETNVGSANISGKGKSQKGSEKGEGKWKAKDISGTKEELKHEGGAGKFERLKEQPITSSPPMQKSSQEKKECNDPLCNNSECEKHGVKSKEHGPKWQGKVHEKKECNDPLCSNPNCAKHGKLAKEKEKEKNVWKEAGKEAGKEGGKEGVVPPGGKSFAEVVSSSQGEEKGKGVGNSPQIVQKSEHKAAINIGEGKIEGKFGSSKDEEGKWKGSVEIGFKGKDEKGHEKQGKSLEASVQSK